MPGLLSGRVVSEQPLLVCGDIDISLCVDVHVVEHRVVYDWIAGKCTGLGAERVDVTVRGSEVDKATRTGFDVPDFVGRIQLVVEPDG